MYDFSLLLTAIVGDDLVEKDVRIVEVARKGARKDPGRDRVSNAGERSNVKSISKIQPAL